MKRRTFLQLGASALLAPTLWIPRRSKAATSGFGSAKHILILFARGGWRSHATFNAVGTVEHNPFGVLSTGAEWKLGAACGGADIIAAERSIDGLAKIAPEISVVACVDHRPGGEPLIDHLPAVISMATGATDGRNGLLSLIGKHHSLYSRGWNRDTPPPVEIGSNTFGMGSGDYARTRPMTFPDARRALASGGLDVRGWSLPARQAIDRRFGAPVPYVERLDGFRIAKEHTHLYADLLSSPLLDLFGSPDAMEHGISNRALLEILGSDTLDTTGDPDGPPGFGPSVALALRMLGFGSPAAVVTRQMFDLHAGERLRYPPRSQDIARQVAGLHYLLKQMPHPSGGVFWDHTVVTVLSEFSRNNTSSETGFNSGDGSDHVSNDPAPARNQAIALMGGPIAAGRLIGATDEEMLPLGKVYSARSLLSTLLDLAGIEPGSFWADPPIAEVVR